MSERPMKRVEDSYTLQVQVITPAHLNGAGRLFGGQLMSWMDIVATVTARRHSGRNVTTAAVRELDFRAPAHGNDTVTLTGHITHAGRTSMEVCVHAYVESLNGERKMINSAYFTMVALDDNEKPAEVPGLLLETEKQKTEWEEAEKRYRQSR